MRKLSEINENVLTDIIDRSRTGNSRKEDKYKSVIIDGNKYIFGDDFLAKGDQFTNDNRCEWTCLAFNKPSNGNVITKNMGEFSVGEYDIQYSDEFDFYVIKDYIGNTTDKLVDMVMKNDSFDKFPEKEIHDVAKRYTEKIFTDNHMNDLAYYDIFNFWTSELCNDNNIHIFHINDWDEIVHDWIPDEFENDEGIMLSMVYPRIDDVWDENFKNDITKAFENNGWQISKTFVPDYSEIPMGSESLLFVKLNN